MEQRENWSITGSKDTDGLYCLKRKAWEWKTNKYTKGFTLAVFFESIDEYGTRYEFIRNNIPIAILNKATARINGLEMVHTNDIRQVPRTVPSANEQKERRKEIIDYLKEDSPAHAHAAMHSYLKLLGYTPE